MHESIDGTDDEAADVAEIVDTIEKYKPKNEYEADVDQQAASELRRDALSPSECINGQLTNEPNDPSRSSDRNTRR